MAEPQPGGRDYGCGLVAVLGGLMLVLSVLGGVWALFDDGLSFWLAVGIVFNLLFWYWVAVGAWRRTTWSSTRTG